MAEIKIYSASFDKDYCSVCGVATRESRALSMPMSVDELKLGRLDIFVQCEEVGEEKMDMSLRVFADYKGGGRIAENKFTTRPTRVVCPALKARLAKKNKS